MTEDNNITLSKYIVTDADYEKAELDQLRAALKRNYTERFLVMTSLMKMDKMFRNAKITHTPYTLEK